MGDGVFLIGDVSKTNNSGWSWDKVQEVWQSTVDGGRSFCWEIWEVLGTVPVVQEMVWLIILCCSWGLAVYLFYHCKVSCQARHCEARQKRLLEADRVQSERERTATDKHCLRPDGQRRGDSDLHWPTVPRRRRSSAKPEPQANPGTSATKVLNPDCSNIAEGVSCPVPVIMSTTSCTRKECKKKMTQVASELRAPSQGIRSVGASGLFVQTRLNFSADTAIKLEGLTAKQCSEISIQISRWRVCCLNDGEVRTMKLDDSDGVPVILYSSYEAGVLRVEGLNLANATIEIASKDNHGTLETKYSKGAGGLEVRSCMTDLLKVESVHQVSMIAFKDIDKDGCTVRVCSLPVLIRDDSLKTVLRDIFPFAILAYFSAKQILLTVIYATPMVAVLTSLTVIALTQILPRSTETTITCLLKKMTVKVACSFYFAFQTLMYERQVFMSNSCMDGEDEEDTDFLSIKDPRTKRPRLRKHTIENDPKDEYSDSDDFYAAIFTEGDLTKAFAEQADHGSGSVFTFDWQWPIYETIYRPDGTSYLKLRGASKDETDTSKMVPFVVVYLNLKDHPWANQVKVEVSSTFLKGLLPSKMDRFKCKRIVSVDGPELFRNYENLTKQCEHHASKLSEPSSSAAASINKEELHHITHLVRFMDQEFEEIKPMYAAMENEGCVTWEMLWAFLPPEEMVIYQDEVTDEDVCGEVVWTNYKETEQGLTLVIKVTKWDYNCQTWSAYTNKLIVPHFAGEIAFKNLSVRPVRFEKDPDATKESFLSHGKTFCELSMMVSHSFMNYRGSMVSMILVDTCYRVVKENADGRVMIDLGSFSKMNPGYPLGSAKPPCEIIRGGDVQTRDITTSPTRMFAPSFVYGFSFRLKKWGCFSVCGFDDIKFNDTAYDDLVMNQAKKDLTVSLVQEHLKEGKDKVSQDNDRVDPIASKGAGCILLCYGPPGTGKTLTAESLSEKLHCPLWCLSVFELGTTPVQLETMLVKVLDVVASWGAILLLDEADVYLERRSSKDLTRNAMTGVFLRHLEYYRGVLFLTTNRDSTFDEAICSRVTMFLHYGKHDENQRNTIWSNLFRRVGLKDTTYIAEFSKPDFNGREIRKIMKTAQTLAKSKNVKLEAHHVRDALLVYEETSNLQNSLNSQSPKPSHQSGP